jgi:hypothetical protein
MVKRFPILFGRYMNDEEDDLIQDLLLWISPYTSVQVAIGMKIVDGRFRDDSGAIARDVLVTVYIFRKQQADLQSNARVLAPYLTSVKQDWTLY